MRTYAAISPCHRVCKHVLQVLEALRSELDKVGVAKKASLVWKIDCSEGDVSDSDLDAFAAYGFGIAPEKVWRQDAPRCPSQNSLRWP